MIQLGVNSGLKIYLVGQTINKINAPKITLTKSRCSFYVWHIYLNFKVIYFDKLLWNWLAKSK